MCLYILLAGTTAACNLEDTLQDVEKAGDKMTGNFGNSHLLCQAATCTGELPLNIAASAVLAWLGEESTDPSRGLLLVAWPSCIVHIHL